MIGHLVLVWACTLHAGYGEACTDNANCTYTGQVCLNDKCDCDTANDYSTCTSGSKCVKALGSVCSTDGGDCNDNVVICDQSSNVCTCASTHYDNNGATTGGSCIEKHGLLKYCSNPDLIEDQCTTANAVCKNGNVLPLCECQDGYIKSGSSCVLADKALGEACNQTSSEKECSDSVAICIGSTCICDANHYDSNGLQLGGTCFPMTNLKVTNVGFTSIQTSQMTVSWSAPAGFSQFINGYKVNWRPKYDHGKNEQSKSIASSVATTRLHVSVGIDPGSAYTVTIVSENDQTQHDSIRSASVFREQAAKPGVPSVIDFSSSDLGADDGRITVVWSAPTGYVSSYHVRLFDGATEITASNPRLAQTSFFYSALKNGYRYTITIQANSETFDGGKTIMGQMFTAEVKTTPKIPKAPSASTCSSPTDSAISLSWSAPTIPNGDIKRYYIQVYKESTYDRNEYTTENGTTHVIDGLNPDTQYSFRVFTENEIGISTEFDMVTTNCKTKVSRLECLATENDSATLTIVISVVLGIFIVLLSVYASYAILLIRRYRTNAGDSEMHNVGESDRKEHTYVNDSFMTRVVDTEEGQNNPVLDEESETEYSRLDDNTRDDKTTYDIIQAI